MKFTFLGTGNSAQVPVYNCDCIACRRALADSRYVRRPCSALLQNHRGQWLIDSGLTDLASRFAPGSLNAIFQTHYHADHAQGLLHLRWGVNLRLPVHGPVDETGFADLYKHPGILDFSRTFAPYQTSDFPGFQLTALPLLHSKPTLGYLIQSEEGGKLAYLTDTQGLEPKVLALLREARLDHCVLDCSYPPRETAGRNHNDLNQALEIHDRLAPGTTWLTHAGHELDRFLMENPAALPLEVQQALDGNSIDF